MLLERVYNADVRSIYVFVCMLCITSSLLLIPLPTVECAGSSGILVDPTNNPFLPRMADFVNCQADTQPCDGYYCPNGAPCSQRICIGNNWVRDMPFSDFTVVPTCMETTKLSLTAAIDRAKSPVTTIQNLGAECKVANQMVVLQTTRSSKDVNNIIPAGADKNAYLGYDVEVGFFYAARRDDEPLYKVVGTFVNYIRSTSILDSPNVFSNDGSLGVLVNTSDIQETAAATFLVQLCSDGTGVVPPQTCPPDDPALTATSAATTTSETTRLLSIILPIVGGVIAIVLIIAMILIIRRRRANKVMRQTVQHTELAQPTMP